MKILLLANYENDRQQSMLRFAHLLEAGLRDLGMPVEIIRPRPFFGRLKPGATGLGKWLGYVDKFLIFPFVLKRAVNTAGNLCLVHICDHSNAFYTRLLRDVPHLVTCNDILAIRSALGEFPQNPTGLTGRVLQRLILNGLRHAHRITCISEKTRHDLTLLLGNSTPVVDVTYMGLNPAYAPMPLAEARGQIDPIVGAGMRYILHVGGNQWYKNRPGALAIFAALHDSSRSPDLKFVMVGPPFDPAMNDFLRLHPDVAAKVISIPDASDNLLRALYSAAELLLFPSIEEGFGWPVIEAHACGCRVVATKKAPLTEAGDGAAFYIAPLSRDADLHEWARDAAAAVNDMLAQDAPARDAAIALGLKNAVRFSLQDMARRYATIYKELWAGQR